ncbi:MAG: beta-ketoacyl synthase chain length factor [Gammaproteobacteria bacterium]
MSDAIFNQAPMSILGTGLCIKNNETANSLGFKDCALDASLLPAMVRRRTSEATRIAVSAATRACSNAATDHELPAVFVSLSGEIQVTDKLCQAIAKNEYPLSPTQFHNSVHNTASSYWSMATNNQFPMMAMSALEDGFALGLLESWCQLQTGAEKILLVVYEEEAPTHLLPDYNWEPCAISLVLGHTESQLATISRPLQSTQESGYASENSIASNSLATAGFPLLRTLLKNNSGTYCIEVSHSVLPWLAEVVIP